MTNFRPGYLDQGSPLGATPLDVSLAADNVQIDVTIYGLVRLTSDNTTATNRTITITNGAVVGQKLVLELISGASTTCELANSGNVKLSAAWTPVQYDALALCWDGTYWIETSRKSPTIASTALTSAHIFVGNGSNIATDVAVSGDIAMANTGAVTISGLAFSKLAALTNGNILVGNGSNVAASVAMSGDATIVNTGAVTIANNAVTTAKINAAAVTVAKLDPAVMLEATGTITQANIIAMNGTPITLIAAPAAGVAHIIDEIEIRHSYSTAAYTGGGDVQLRYEAGSPVNIVDIDSTIVTNTSSTGRLMTPTIYDLDNSTGTALGFDIATVAATAVTITNSTAVFAAGNVANVLKYRIRYHSVTLLS